MKALNKSSLSNIYQLISLNFLWILYTALGVGVFGIVPATYALYKCLYDYMKEGTQTSLKEFHIIFKKNFIRLNLYLPFLAIVMLILLIDYTFAINYNVKALIFLNLFFGYYVYSIYHLFFLTSCEAKSLLKLKSAIKEIYALPFILSKELITSFSYYLIVLVLSSINDNFIALWLINIPIIINVKAFIKRLNCES